MWYNQGSENKGYQPDSHKHLRFFYAHNQGIDSAPIVFDAEICRQGHASRATVGCAWLVAYLDDRFLRFAFGGMAMNTICATCGDPVQVKPSRLGKRNFCSMSCYGASRNLQREVFCFVCGASVTRKPSTIGAHVFCSSECVTAFNSKPKNQVQLSCQHCGKTFSVAGGRKERSKYCSVRCTNAARVGKPHPTMQKVRVEKSCMFCGKSFFIKPSHANKRHCCSRKCHGALLSQGALGYDPTRRAERSCVICGKVSLVKMSRTERAGTYCSVECMATDYRNRMKGEANPNYRHGLGASTEGRREWGRFRRSDEGIRTITDLMRIQQGECVYCQTDIRHGFEVDHRIPLSRGGSNRAGNLQLSCSDCNRQKHNRFHIEFLVWRKRQAERRPA